VQNYDQMVDITPAPLLLRLESAQARYYSTLFLGSAHTEKYNTKYI
jgi:hypothetical protein